MYEIMTLPEAAAFMRMNAEVLRRKAHNGEIPGRKVGKQWKFSKAQLLAWIETGMIAVSIPTVSTPEPTKGSKGGGKPEDDPGQQAEGTRVCKVCHEVKPLDNDHFQHKVKDGRGYFVRTCRDCAAAIRRGERPSQAKQK